MEASAEVTESNDPNHLTKGVAKLATIVNQGYFYTTATPFDPLSTMYPKRSSENKKTRPSQA